MNPASESANTMNYKDLVKIALFASLISALGLIPRIDFPFAAGVPITAQTLGVMLAGLILGARNAMLSVLLFIFVVALGAPVLSGGRGGLGVFFTPTVGFLVGWAAGAWVCGALFAALKKLLPDSVFTRAFFACLIGGVITVYAFGIPGLALIAKLDLSQAALASLVFVPGDLLKSILAAWLASRLDLSIHSKYQPKSNHPK